jgi:thymidylate kinase
LAGEYDREPIKAILTIGSAVIPYVVDGRSWFVMGSYRLTSKVQVGSYYSHYVDKAADTTQPANYSKDWVVSGRYDFNSYFYAKLEGHFLHGTALGYYTDTNPNGLTPNSNMLAAKIGFSF